MAIVVGVDGSPESKDALRWAISEARLRGTDVQAVHVWRYPVSLVTPEPFLMGPALGPSAIDPDRLREQAEQRLAGIVAEVARGDADVRVEPKVVEGHPSEVLVQAAATAELLVVGSRGHGGFAGLLLGSVSQACAHHAHCPVVIIRCRDDTTAQP